MIIYIPKKAINNDTISILLIYSFKNIKPINAVKSGTVFVTKNTMTIGKAFNA